METKRIKCPSCGVLLDVRNSQNESVKTITCPQCKAQLRVAFSQQQGTPQSFGETQYVSRDAGETQYVGQTAAGGDETIYAGMREAVAKPGFLVCGGQRYPLDFGDNIVGRKATTSCADIQIAVDDRYMSRQHLVISVLKMLSAKARAVVSNYHNKNASYVDGQLLRDGDKLILADGSVVKMGNTTVVYHQK